MFYFCTYFDRNYLAHGLALIHSLAAHCQAFRIWVLCMDDETHDVLNRSRLPGVQAIRLQEFEQGDEALVETKSARTALEYYFTCTPSLPMFVFEHWPEVELITYLDADLYFFSDPAPIFAEIGGGSIAIVRQRVAPPHHQTAIEKYGIYTVSWVSFRRDSNGLECLHRWRKQCLNWCFNRFEDHKHGDQKYLDDWPERFSNVVVLEHKGADLARWNVNNYQVRVVDGHNVLVDEQPLVFYHFSGLTQVAPGIYNPRFHEDTLAQDVLRRFVYVPYFQMVEHLDRTALRRARGIARPLDDGLWRKMRLSAQRYGRGESLSAQVRRYLSLGWNVLSGRYMVFWRNRLVWPR